MTSPLFSLLHDRPVTVADDLLWNEDEDFRRQLDQLAETIVRSATGLSGIDSMTFGIYGQWGMGKSSALRMLKELVTTKADEQARRFVFCDYAAPQFERLTTDIRTTFFMRVLTALTGSQEAAIRRFLDPAVRVRMGPDIVPPGNGNSESPVLHSRVLEEVSTTLFAVVDIDLELKKLLFPDGEQPRVLVVLVDDLDRCEPESVWSILDAVRRLSTVSNIHFVLATDDERLVGVMRARFPERPHYAAEKYVQHAIYVPTMDERRLKRFVGALIEKMGISGPTAATLRSSSTLLFRGLQSPSPRSVKRFMNALSTSALRLASTNEDGRAREVKLRILEYGWPDFFSICVRPALTEQSSPHLRLMISLETACEQYDKDPDDEFLAFRLRKAFVDFRRAQRFSVDSAALDPVSADDRLRSFLGSAPSMFAGARSEGAEARHESPGGSAQTPNTSSPMRPPRALGRDQAQARFVELYVRSEAAEAAGNGDETIAYARQALDLLRQNQANFDEDFSPQAGNLAINAEVYGDRELAEGLYRVSLLLDPEHSNNMQNFVDYIVKARRDDLFDEAAALVVRLRNPPHSSHRLDRTVDLEQRLIRLRGGKPDPEPNTMLRAAAEDLDRRFRAKPDDPQLYMRAAVAWDGLNESARVIDVSRLHYAASTNQDHRFAALRAVADTVGKSDAEADELLALDLYRHILNSATIGVSTLAQRQVTATLHNYATLLKKRGFPRAAEDAWLRAYRRNPNDLTIRRVFGTALYMDGRHEEATRVVSGQPLAAEGLDDVETLPEYFLEPNADRWWESGVDVHTYS